MSFSTSRALRAVYRFAALNSINRNSRLHLTKCQCRVYSQSATESNLYSALYVSARYNDQVYPVLRPDLDYEFVVQNWETIKNSVSKRGMNREEFALTNEELGQIIDEFKDLGTKIKKSINLVTRKHKEKDFENIESLKAEQALLREKYYHCENRIVPLLLKRPNILHPETGEERKVIDKCFEHDSDRSESHLDFGQRNKLLFFADFGPGCYYMVDKLAQMELAVIEYFRNALRNCGFKSFSAPSVVQTALLEATGAFFAGNQSVIQLKGRKEGLVQDYLVGSSSLEAFAAHFTRMVIDKLVLPIRLFNIGRHYSATSNTSMGLYNTVQSTRIECLTACEANNVDGLFNDITDHLKKVYKQLNVPHQVVVVSAKELNQTETIRIQIELWSPYFQRYVPCASVSQHSDFLSKRLMMQFREKGATSEYVHCIGTTAVSVPVLIAGLIENRPGDDLFVPSALQPYFL